MTVTDGPAGRFERGPPLTAFQHLANLEATLLLPVGCDMEDHVSWMLEHSYIEPVKSLESLTFGVETVNDSAHWIDGYPEI